jgi:hypothetical protein
MVLFHGNPPSDCSGPDHQDPLTTVSNALLEGDSMSFFGT